MIEFDTSKFSPDNKRAARVLQLRAQIALNQAQDVLKTVSKEGDAPDFTAVSYFAQYSIGQTSDALKGLEELSNAQSENSTVQILGGIVLQAQDRSEDAISLLSKHQGSLEA